MLQQVPAVVLTEVGVHIDRTLDHGAAAQRSLVSPHEAENLVGATTNGHLLGGNDVIGQMGQLLGECPDPLGVVGADQSVEQIITEHALEMRNRTKCIH